ncbi:MAG: hypothetical protein ACM3H8_09695 [Sphingobacteriales bacterium]
MKNIIISAVATVLLLIIGCKKNSTKEFDNTLPGAWKEYQYFMSPGAGGEWEPGNGLIVTLNKDLSYTTNNEQSFWGKSGKINNLTDSTFTINPPFFNGPATLRYTVKDGVFEVWYICIEGCGSRFRKN